MIDKEEIIELYDIENSKNDLEQVLDHFRDREGFTKGHYFRGVLWYFPSIEVIIWIIKHWKY